MNSSRTFMAQYQLYPTELNALMYSLARKVEPSLPETLLSPFDITWIQANGRHIGICKMRKDSLNDKIEPNLEYIAKEPLKFPNEEVRDNCILLIPLCMCDYYKMTLKQIKRNHSGLVVIDTRSLQIDVLDSEGYWRTYFYADSILAIVDKLITGKMFHYDPVSNYHAYGVQEGILRPDFVSCGYYVFNYAKHLLETGNIEGCKDIQLNITHDYKNKHVFLMEQGITIFTDESLEQDFTELIDEDLSEGEVELDTMLSENKSVVTDTTDVHLTESSESLLSSVLGFSFFTLGKEKATISSMVSDQNSCADLVTEYPSSTLPSI